MLPIICSNTLILGEQMFSRYEFKKADFRLKGNQNKCTINFDGEIFDKNLKRLETFVDEMGYPSIEIEGYLGLRIYRVIDLMTMQFKNIHIPCTKFSEIVSFNINDNKLDLSAKNIGYRFKNGKIESLYHKGFYHVPSLTRYVINESGIVKIHDNDKEVSITVAKGNKDKNVTGGYCNFSAFMFNSIARSFARHRALALTFFDYPNNVDDLVVNHIDGIPGNDTLDNLEFCTRAENNKHAKENGLKIQQKAITARNVFTGEISTFLSMADCERALNVHWDTLVRRLKDPERFGEVLPCGYQIKYSENELEFPAIEDPIAAVEESKQAIEIEVMDYRTKEITIYPSIGSAAKTLGLKDSSISWKLNNKSLTPLKGYGFRLRPEDDFPECTVEQITKSMEPQNLLVCAHNLLDDSELTFESINKAIKWYGVDFNESLRKGKQPLYEDGWRFKFEESEWEVIEDVEETLYRLKKGVQVYDVSTGAIQFYQSAKQAGDSLGIDSKWVRELAFSRGHKISKGRRFRLGDNLMEPWPTND